MLPPARRGPDDVALELRRARRPSARRFAKALVAAGAGKGTRVALLMGNRPEWVEAAFGVALAGGVLVPVNTLFEPPEIEHVLRHSDTRRARPPAAAWPTTAYDEQVAADASPTSPTSRRGVCLGTASYDDFLAAGDAVGDDELDAGAPPRSRPIDDALVIYTSGSTGKPKGVLHAHRAAAIQSWRFAQQLRLDPDRPGLERLPLLLDGRLLHGHGRHPGRRRLPRAPGALRAPARPWR